MMGIKMHIRLTERRIEAIDDLYPDSTVDWKERKDLRDERRKLVDGLKYQRIWYENFMDS